MRGWMSVVWLLAALAAYCFIWMGNSHGYAEKVQANIEAFASKHPDLDITYHDVSFSGFPFGYTSVFEHVEVTYGDYTIALGDVAFELRHSEQSRFLITPRSPTTEAKWGEEKHFSVIVTEYPILSVRAGEKPAEGEVVWQEFAVGMPSNLQLKLGLGDAERTVGFNFPEVKIPVWRKFPKQPHRSIETYIYMLDEAFLR